MSEQLTDDAQRGGRRRHSHPGLRGVVGNAALRWLAGGSALVLTLAGLAPATSAASAAVPLPAPAVSRAQVAAQPVLPARAHALGTLPARQPVSGAVALRPRDPDALAAFAAAVSTPGSADYGHYLGAGQFASRFGPAPTAVDAVRAQLRSAGLRVTSVSTNGLLVDFAGTSRQVASAFATHFEAYHLASGSGAYAPTTALSLPSDIAGVVQGVLGLNTLTKLQPASTPPLGRRTQTPGTAAAKVPRTTSTTGSPVACADATSTAEQAGGLTDTQIADSYGVGGLYNRGDIGAGQTVAIFELEPFARSDIAVFDSCYFGAARAAAMLQRLHTISVDGGQQIGPGEGEAALDIENVSAVAPGATIDVYEAPNTDLGALDNYNAIVEDDTAKVVSTSWGLCEQALQQSEPGVEQLENIIFEQAAAQGQSVFAAAGDAGSDDCAESGPAPVPPDLSVDDPGSQPFVTSAGGLTITDPTQPPVEQVWNDGADWGAGGGGLSDVWPEPAWQADSKVPGINNTTIIAAAAKRAGSAFCQANRTYDQAERGCREVPDVSAQADEFTGAITIVWDGQWSTVGGTSSAAPLWAAMTTDVNASPACHATGHGVGFINPSLYALAGIPTEYQASFTDVTSGNNDSYGIDGGLFPATKGYDMASGLGSPELTGRGGTRGLAYYLCTTAATGRPTVSKLSPSAISSTSGSQFTVTGTGFESAAGSPQVAGVQIGGYVVPAGSFDVTSPTSVTVTMPPASALSGNEGGGTQTDGNGTYNVTVTLTGGLTSAPDTSARLVVYDPNAAGAAPEVDAIGPSGGALTGGNTVLIYGSGFTGATGVTFGGVPATRFSVGSDGTITATVPAYAGGTACAQVTEVSSDVCQTQVQVTTGDGTSPTSTIEPAYQGAYSLDALGVFAAPAGTEAVAAATEYDYLPAPHITSVNSRPAGANGRHYASEAGGTVETINGVGLGILGLEWVDVGPANLANDADTDFTYVSPTQIKVALPPAGPTSTVLDVPASVQTQASPNVGDLAGSAPSTTVEVPYAPQPSVSGVTTARGAAAGPSTGGTTVTVTGSGLIAANRVKLSDPSGFSVSATTHIVAQSNGEVTFTTLAANPGRDALQVCDPTGCSAKTSADVFIYYPPGKPTLGSVSPHSGPAHGGQTVTVTGSNLGFLRQVWFGSAQATTWSDSSVLDSGNTTTFTVVVPKGTAGRTVEVRVVTEESAVTDPKQPKSPVNPHVTYTYQR